MINWIYLCIFVAAVIKIVYNSMLLTMGDNRCVKCRLDKGQEGRYSDNNFKIIT